MIQWIGIVFGVMLSALTITTTAASSGHSLDRTQAETEK